MSDRLDNPILHWPNDPTIAGCNQHCHLAEQAGADVHASSGATVAPAPAPSALDWSAYPFDDVIDKASDSRYSDEFIGNLFRARLRGER